MLFAHEANRKTLENITMCITKELSDIEKQINAAIKDGKFQISNSGYLQKRTKIELEAMGYKVETYNQYNESSYTISWKDV